MPELPLHRSLLRAAVLAPVVSLLPALALPRLLTGRYAPSRDALTGILLMAIGCAGWTALLVVAGDLAGAGSRLRRALVVAAVPALLPLLLITAMIQVEQGRFDRASAWEAPAAAVEALSRDERPPGVALLLSSLVPFVAILATRAHARPRPLAAHAAVVTASGYASLLLLEHLSGDLALPLALGRQAMLICGSALALQLLFLETRLGASGREALRGLAGRAPPRSHGLARDALLVGVVLGAAIAGAAWIYPAHHGWRMERRARGGDRDALRYLLDQAPFRTERFLQALESPWEGERAAAFDLVAEAPHELGSSAFHRASESALRDASPLARAAATRCLARLPSPLDPDRATLLAALAGAADDGDPRVRSWGRIGQALHAARELTPAECAGALDPLDGQERRELARHLDDRRGERADLDLLALMAVARSGSPRALEAVVNWLNRPHRAPPPCPELAEALRPLVAGTSRSEITPELAALAGLDGTE